MPDEKPEQTESAPPAEAPTVEVNVNEAAPAEPAADSSDD